MRLNDEEKAMLAGALGEPRRWAIAHQIAVGEFFDAADFVTVSQAHIMADTESLGEAGVRFLEGLAAAPEPARRVRVPAITDPRGIDFAIYRRLGQNAAMVALERRAIAALSACGVLMTDTCINYQTITRRSWRRCAASMSPMAIPAPSSTPTASSAPAAISRADLPHSPPHSPAAPHATAITSTRAVAPLGGSGSRRIRAVSANGVRWAASSARLAAPIGRCR